MSWSNDGNSSGGSVQSAQNDFPDAAFWVWGTARSRENGGWLTILVECLERIRRSVSKKIALLKPKFCFKMIFTDLSEMPTSLPRSLIVNKRFASSKYFISFTWASSVDVNGQPGRTLSSSSSCAYLKYLYHLYKFLFDIVCSPNVFYSILNVSAHENKLRRQNLLKDLCPTNPDIIKIDRITFFVFLNQSYLNRHSATNWL